MKSLWGKIPLHGSGMTLTIVFIFGFVILVVTSGGTLLSHLAISSLLIYLAVPILIGMAQMVVLAVGQMNLAIGAMGGATSALMAVLMTDHGLPVWAAIIAGLACSTALGALNGVLVVLTRLNGFIVTLGTMTMLLGVQYLLVRTFTVDGYPDWLKKAGLQTVVGIPYMFLTAILTAIVVSWYFSRTIAGRRLLATGGNPLAARLSGISNDASVFQAHVISGVLVGIASLVTIASAPGINRSIGGDWLLPSFAAAIIGGVMLTGGAVAVFGTVMAACVLRLVDVARAQYSLDTSWVNFVVGVVVLFTVALSEWRQRRSTSQKMTVEVPE
jgi:Ribose/xylose/arabinose/galactoside ABC-type transport systems, permease components